MYIGVSLSPGIFALTEDSEEKTKALQVRAVEFIMLEPPTSKWVWSALDYAVDNVTSLGQHHYLTQNSDSHVWLIGSAC